MYSRILFYFIEKEGINLFILLSYLFTPGLTHIPCHAQIDQGEVMNLFKEGKLVLIIFFF